MLILAAVLTTTLMSPALHAGSVNTTCELIDTGTPRTFVCSSFGIGATITSQTWSLTTAGTIIQQGLGIMAAECGGTTNLGYQFIAALSDGMTDTGSGSLPCQSGGGGGSPIPGDPPTECEIDPFSERCNQEPEGMPPPEELF